MNLYYAKYYAKLPAKWQNILENTTKSVDSNEELFKPTFSQRESN